MHPTIIDTVNWNDIVTIKHASSKGELVRTLMGIARQLPSPRAYVVEPHVSPSSQEGLVWEIGQNILYAQLAQAGIAVISPDALGALARLNEKLGQDVPLWNPILKYLIYAKDLLDAIYLPAQDTPIAREQFKGYARAAEKQGITVHIWEPEVTSVRVPRTRA